MKFITLLACLLLGTAAAFAPPTPSTHSSTALHASHPNKIAAIAAASQLLVVESARAGDLEVADLPPPYVPVAFGILLLGGVGWLTSSLGDLMSDEASLGFQSGARAKKEMERSRSSYFKKK